MPELDLEKLERLAAQATPGPWTAGRHDMQSIVEGCPAKYIYSSFQAVAIACGEDVAWHQVICNAEYITAACNAVPELIKRVRKLERQREFFLSTLKENNLCPGKGRCWPDGSELEEWDCSAANNRECWIQAAKEAGSNV